MRWRKPINYDKKQSNSIEDSGHGTGGAEREQFCRPADPGRSIRVPMKAMAAIAACVCACPAASGAPSYDFDFTPGGNAAGGPSYMRSPMGISFRYECPKAVTP
jgi:hypothetical protein